MRKIPKELKNLESFTHPIQIIDNDVLHSLSDFGDSIILMPLLVRSTLGLSELKPCTMVPQIVDKD